MTVRELIEQLMRVPMEHEVRISGDVDDVCNVADVVVECGGIVEIIAEEL